MNMFYSYLGLIVFWLTILYGLIFFIGRAYQWILPKFKKTIIYLIYCTIRVWYRHDVRKKPISANLSSLKFLKKRAATYPKFVRGTWVRLIERGLDELRQDIIQHGEVADF